MGDVIGLMAPKLDIFMGPVEIHIVDLRTEIVEVTLCIHHGFHPLHVALHREVIRFDKVDHLTVMAVASFPDIMLILQMVDFIAADIIGSLQIPVIKPLSDVMNSPIFTAYIDDGGTGSLGIKIEMTDEMLCERILEHGMPLILRGGPQDQTLVGVEGQIRKNLVIQVALPIVAACIDAQTFVCISSRSEERRVRNVCRALLKCD